MKDASQIVALVCDFGTLGIELARTLSKTYKRVLLYIPNEDEFRNIKECCKGDGIDGVERVDEIFDPEHFDDLDLVLFPDIGWGQTQKFLRAQGKAVWGSMGGDGFELYRTRFLDLMKRLDLPVIPSVKIKGLTNLELHLKDEKNKWVKVNKFRGNMETFHWIDMDHSSLILDGLKVEFGGLKEQPIFVVQDDLETDVEIGFDGWTVDGQYPESVFSGYEKKNECYDPETEILTKQGWKRFYDLDGSEQFLTLNTSDKSDYKMEYQLATKYHSFDYTGKMFQLETQNTSLLVTPNHRLFVQVNSQNKNAPKVKWADSKGVVREFHLGKKERKLVEAKDLPKNFKMPWPKSPRLRPTSKRNIKFKFGDVSFLKSDFATFLGIYLSEGWTNGKRIVVAQKKYAQYFESLLNEFGLKFYKSVNRGCFSFQIVNDDLAEYLLQFGKSADKHVPQWIKDSGKSVIETFLHFYCLGDGSMKPTTKSTRNNKRARLSMKYSTISKKMADDLQELLIKVGFSSSLREDQNKNGPIYMIQSHSIRCQNYIFEKHKKWVDYSGKVYCVTVPNGIVMVRRNGKPIWCGNSYLGSLLPYDKLPDAIKDVNEAMAPVFKEMGYRNFFATELRIKDDVAYFIDPTMRMPGQTGEQLLETCTNLAEVIWHGANGEMIVPEYAAKFSAEATMYYTAGEDDWRVLTIPEKVRDSVKLYHFCELDGVFHFPPAKNTELGVVLGMGDTIVGAIDNLKENFDAMKDEPVKIRPDGFKDLVESIESAEKEGIEFTDQPLPEPEEVV